MDIKRINDTFSVSGQITEADLPALQQAGVRTLICNRPDKEAPDQPEFAALASAAQALGMQCHLLPVVHDTINSAQVRAFTTLMETLETPVHAWCRSGLRSVTLWSLSRLQQGAAMDEVLAAPQSSGFDFAAFPAKFAGVIDELANRFADLPVHAHPEVLIVGAGAGGISVASSLLRRQPGLKITLVDPAEQHYYQPGFTLVGAGVFTLAQTRRAMQSLIPEGVTWIKASVTHFLPEDNQVVLDNNTRLVYDRLVVSAGLKLNWGAIPGLQETLGKNGVTSNYRPDLSEYTWELVQNLKEGPALFTQPPMPIKCAGAPQKVLYLSADYWRKQGLIGKISVHFYNAGAVLFGVKEYVPALQSYMDKYAAQLHFGHNLVKVDGPAKIATFAMTGPDGTAQQVQVPFGMLHVCPPQCAPDFIRNSPLADLAGWVDVDKGTLRHVRYPNIWGLGDATNSPNAKTAAAVRKQAPVVASNLIQDMNSSGPVFHYDGYGSCPLTVENGKIVLAEFAYGGKLTPTFPRWLLEGTRPSKLAWFLKKSILPWVYWSLMLKGKEILVKPENLD